MKTTEYTLKNGLKVIHNQKEDSKMVDVRLLLGAGNFYNNYYAYTPGIAHFLEHVVHEKTINYKNKEDLTAIVTDFGGARNASTYPGEKMTFFATVLNEYADNACDYVSQIVFHSKFDQVAVDKHKKIIKEELLARFKSPSVKSWNLLKELAYANTNFIFHTLGTEDSLEEIKLEELTKYYEDRFVPQNCILSISGDITLDECNRLVDKYFSDIKHNINNTFNNHIKDLNTQLIPEIKEKKQGNVIITDKQAVVNFGAILEGMNDQKYLNLLLLLRFLTVTSNSILNKRLREENNLLYHISGNMSGNQLSSIAYFELNVQPENIQQCLDIIKYEINEIALGKITNEELDKAKKTCEASVIFYNQSIQDESDYNASIKLMFCDIRSRDEYIQKILDVSVVNVVKSAKWLSENLNILAVCSNSENKYNF